MTEDRTLVLIALHAAIVAVLGFIPAFAIPLAGGVPITAQSLGVMLAGVMLGPWRGAAAVLLFLLVVALGAPLLSGARGGISVFFGPTAGFLLGWPVAALVAGTIMRQTTGLSVFLAALLACGVGGIVVLYAIGIPVAAHVADAPLSVVALGSLAFVPGDLVKSVLCALIAQSVAKGYPEGLLSRRVRS